MRCAALHQCLTFLFVEVGLQIALPMVPATICFTTLSHHRNDPTPKDSIGAECCLRRSHRILKGGPAHVPLRLRTQSTMPLVPYYQNQGAMVTRGSWLRDHSPGSYADLGRLAGAPQAFLTIPPQTNCGIWAHSLPHITFARPNVCAAHLHTLRACVRWAGALSVQRSVRASPTNGSAH